MDVPGWPEIFRGSDAVFAGLVTWSRLHGPGFARVLPDVWVSATRLPLTHEDRCRAVFAIACTPGRSNGGAGSG